MKMVGGFFSGIVFFAVTVVVIIVFVVGVFFVTREKDSKDSSGIPTAQTSPAVDPKVELDQLLSEIGKVMLLSDKETPTLATVSEVEKLANQSFFKNAQNGDKVIIYQNAQKAILWRPETKMIIEVGTVTNNQEAQKASVKKSEEDTEEDAAQVTPAVKLDQEKRIVIANGTDKTGLTTKIAEQMKTIAGAVVVERISAEKNTYEDTIVIDLTGERKVEAQYIAQELEATVVELPPGETRPENADFLIIVAADKAP